MVGAFLGSVTDWYFEKVCKVRLALEAIHIQLTSLTLTGKWSSIPICEKHETINLLYLGATFTFGFLAALCMWWCRQWCIWDEAWPVFMSYSACYSEPSPNGFWILVKPVFKGCVQCSALQGKLLRLFRSILTVWPFLLNLKSELHPNCVPC